MPGADITHADEAARFARSLAACEKQLKEGMFAEPLDSTQVRRLTNIEHILAEYDNTKLDQPGAYQSRVVDISRRIRPWVDKKNALLRSLDVKPAVEEDIEVSKEQPQHRLLSADCNDESNTREIVAPKQVSASLSSSPLLPALPSTDQRQTNFADQRAELLGEMDGLRRRGVVPDSVEGVERLLKSQRATQDDLSSDLVKMASILKKNTLAFGDLIEKDKAVVDEASEILGGNVTHMNAHGSRLDKYRKRSWGTTGMTWMMVLVVVSVFFIMVMFMRIAPKRY
ncbi:hypothetical protein LPJ66_003174 [Kickxella alabastrina]|uniref:Uncharacterized protein n=1 Tax=Kickxella alabastrina TaxID=61397 RepID=A0ACC1IMN4_9FUNG|nr:hypothetical protein LPJ66_003174 [Kickxella alabastrina]